ncbi:MAG: transglutaminase family protein [Leptospiraceae bacterium]|nr:transglutaminase family protein [Leptospiraceae bacterium]
MPEYSVTHVSRYDYEETVSLCQNLALMEPQDSIWQTVRSARIDCNPMPSSHHRRRDYFGNAIHYFSIEQPHSHIEFTASTDVITNDIQLPDPSSTPAFELVRDQIQRALAPEDLDVLQFTLPSRFVPTGRAYAELASRQFTPGRPILEAALALNQQIYSEFTYDGEATTILTPLSEVLSIRRGVCQDFSHIFLAALRSLGLPCRYVSGYIETYPPEGQARLQGADASHAWVSIFIPELGWIDLDPTNGKPRTHEYVQAAAGRDYQDVSPLRGVLFGGGKHKVHVSVDVRRKEAVA